MALACQWETSGYLWLPMATNGPMALGGLPDLLMHVDGLGRVWRGATLF